MKRELIALALVLGFSSVAAADVRQSHICVRDGMERTVQLIAENSTGVPCAVVYEKPMEDQSTTRLWTAQNDAEFCRTKYDNFIVKLESQLSWSCSVATASSRPSTRPSTSISRQSTRFGLDLIRNAFPTGYYRKTVDNPHTGDTTLCPADGYFFWNTQNADMPAFEMDRQTVFNFNLKPFVAKPHAVITRDIGTAQCDYTVQSSYCIENRQAESAMVSSRSADSVSCSPAGLGDGPVRALALISNSDSYSIPQACQADAPAASMAMATLPSGSSANARQKGFELAIEKYSGSTTLTANCRYVRKN